MIIGPTQAFTDGSGNFIYPSNGSGNPLAFIAGYNDTARPFVWTKSVVHQKRLKPCFAL